MTYLQNNLGIFKIEGPRPLWLERIGGHFPGPGSGKAIIERWGCPADHTVEGHDGGDILGQRTRLNSII